MIRVFFTAFCLGLALLPASVSAQASSCSGTDQACLLGELEKSADAITDVKWRDISYRELAKTLAANKQTPQALAILEKISNPDTKALTIRAIGMTAATHNLSVTEYEGLFKNLTERANAIEHIPSKEIAYTYIAMAQSFARQDEAAVVTTNAMTNAALKHKAFGEMAEIQAERGDAEAAIATLRRIDLESYRNKASRTVTILLADKALYNDAATLAQGITNANLRAEAIQYILNKQMAPAKDVPQ